MSLRSLGYWLSPIQPSRDFGPLAYQLASISRAFALSLMASGLLPESYLDPIPGAGEVEKPDWIRKRIRRKVSVLTVLGDATSVFTKWFGIMWQAGVAKAADDSFLTRFGAGLEGLAEFSPQILQRGLNLASCWSVVITGMLCTLWLLLSGMVGTAHAATAATVNNDLARGLLSQVFTIMGGSAATGLAAVLGTMVGLLGSTAMLLAGIAALLGLFTLVIEWNWNKDRFKSQYNPWIFLLRAVIAIGLIVPAASGYGLGQRLGLFTVLGLSDGATTLWTNSASTISGGSNGSIFGAMVAQPTAPLVTETVANMWLQDVCTAAVQYGPNDSQDFLISKDAGPTNGANYTLNDLMLISSGQTTANGVSYCGSVTMPSLTTTNSVIYNTIVSTVASWAPQSGSAVGSILPSFITDAGDSQAVINTHTTTYQKYAPQVQDYATNFVKGSVPVICSGACAPTGATAKNLAALIKSYQSDLNAGLQQVWGDTDQTETNLLLANMTNGGWIAAGTWARQIADVNAIFSRMANSIPIVTPPGNLTGDAEAAVTQASGILPSVGTLAGQGPPVGGTPAGTFMDGIGGFFNTLMAGFLQIDQQNPITSMANIGTGMIRTSELVIGLTMITPSGGTANGALAKAIGVAGAWAMGPARLLYPFLPDPGMVREVMFGFLLIGMALAYWVPMLPFIRFMFAVLGWFQEVVTVIILIPLMLTQMVTVEGHGLFPPMVKSCAWSILAASLRPIIAVIGFVAGILMVTAWVALLNQAFLAGFRNSQNGETWGITGTFAYYAIYLFMVYASMNGLFKMPEYITHAMYRVLNANAGGERDDAGAIGTAANALAQRFLPGITRPRAAK